MTQQTPPATIARTFEAELRDDPDGPEPFRPRYNLAPTDPLSVVRQRGDRRVVEAHRWGLIPSWAKRPTEGARMINARAETVAGSPAFRHAFANRRCIVPSDGFYEWRRVDGARQPFFLHPPPGNVLAMAGLWSAWKDPASGLWVLSAAVITTVANDLVATVHDRMPVLLPRESWAEWLDPSFADPAHLLGLLVPAPDDVLAMHPVSRAVNSVRHDGPELIVAIGEPEAIGEPRVIRSPGAPVQGTLFD